MGTPCIHFQYDFGDPSMNIGSPQFSSMFIVELEESAVAMNLLGSALLLEVSSSLARKVWLSH